MYSCPHCQKTFSCIGSRNHHQRTAKYCLKLRKKAGQRRQCPDCDEIFTSQGNLARHRKSCHVRIQQQQTVLNDHVIIIKQQELQIKMLEQQVVELKDQLERHLATKDRQFERLAMAGIKKATHTTNHLTNNIQLNAPLNLTPEIIQERIAGLTSDHLVNGVKAVVGWIRDELLVDTDSGELTYRCTNPKDGTFRFIDDQGTLQKDCQGRKLISLIQQPFNEQGRKVCAELINDLEQTSEDDPEARQLAFDRLQQGHMTFNRLRQMKDSNSFIRELGILTYI